MTKKILIFVAIIALFYSRSYAQKFPVLDSVLFYFHNVYETENAAGSFNLAKKLDGYYIQSIDIGSKTVLSSDKFWDAHTASYLEIPYSKRPDIDFKRKISNLGYINLLDAFKYRISKHYGYEGWEHDEITYLNQLNGKLTDDEYYALARANFSCVLNKFVAADFESNKTYIKNTFDRNQLSQNELDTVFHYFNASQVAYNKLILQNPNYQTQIAAIKTKADQDLVSLFNSLCMYQNEKDAYVMIKDTTLFSDYYKNYGRSLLDGLPRNAILFTYSDMETYVTMYLQAKEKYRTDISILNINLLNSPNYLNYIKKPGELKLYTPVQFSLEDKDYGQSKFVFAKISDSGNGLQKTATVIQNLKDNPEEFNGVRVIMIEGKKFKEHFDTISYAITFNKPYLTLNDLAILDIIRNNIATRPIHFAAPCPKFGSSDNLQFKGNTIAFTPNISSNCYSCNYASIDITELKKFIYNYKFQKNETMEFTIPNVIIEATQTACDFLAEKDDRKEIKNILTHFSKNIVPSQYNIGYPYIYLLRAARRLGDSKLSLSMEQKFMESWKDIDSANGFNPNYTSRYISYIDFLLNQKLITQPVNISKLKAYKKYLNNQ